MASRVKASTPLSWIYFELLLLVNDPNLLAGLPSTGHRGISQQWLLGLRAERHKALDVGEANRFDATHRALQHAKAGFAHRTAVRVDEVDYGKAGMRVSTTRQIQKIVSLLVKVSTCGIQEVLHHSDRVHLGNAPPGKARLPETHTNRSVHSTSVCFMAQESRPASWRLHVRSFLGARSLLFT